MRDQYPHLIRGSLGSPDSASQVASRSVSCFCCFYFFTVGATFSENCPLQCTDLDRHLIRDSLGPSKPATQMATRSVQPFCTDDHRVFLYFTTGRPSPLKIAPIHGWMWTPSNTCFPGPTRVLNPNGISIGSAVFAGLISVTDRPTDPGTRSVTVGRIYVQSTVMRPKNSSFIQYDVIL